MKTCNTCNTDKNYDQFWKKTSTKDGYQDRCIQCFHDYYEQTKIAESPYVYKVVCPDGAYYYGQSQQIPSMRLRTHLRLKSTSLSQYIRANNWTGSDLTMTKIMICADKEEASTVEANYIYEGSSDPLMLNIRLRAKNKEIVETERF